MTSEELELAARLAAVPGIWRAGMRFLRDLSSPWRPSSGRLHVAVVSLLDAYPDLTDPATRGVLLDVAREKHHTFASPEYLGADGWRFGAFRADTEGAAIALAILGAP